jgi:hypothetical protein
MEAPSTLPTASKRYFLLATIAHPTHDGFLFFHHEEVTDPYGAPPSASLYTLSVDKSGEAAAAFTFTDLLIHIEGTYRLRLKLLTWRKCVATTRSTVLTCADVAFSL